MTRPVAKQPPAHGSEARYKGSTTRPPCRCRRCVRGWTQAGQRRELLRLAGTPASLTRDEVDSVIAHIRACQAVGMSQNVIGRKADVAQSTISRLLKRPDAGCLRAQGERILAVRPGDFDNYGDRPATGTVRRVRGLYLAGHGPAVIAASASLSEAMVTELAGGKYPVVSARTQAGIRRAVTELAGRPGLSIASRRRAEREAWSPLGAWDDIDDPAAVPDWTGHCGTDHGWWIHSVNNIPACPPCETAHQQWKQERAHLTHSERWSEIGKAKAAASNRGATVAADARELMRISGLDYEQAAQRLGVTRNHLQQELLRHPDTETELAA